MRGVLAVMISLFVLACAAGSTHAQLLECRGAQKPQHVAELIFGRSIGGRIEVSEKHWMQFVDEEITPRFPDGLTVFDAAGQWRDKTSKNITRESSKIVLDRVARQCRRYSLDSTRSSMPTSATLGSSRSA